MPTPFGRAMLATVHGQPQRFRMTMVGGDAIEMDCRGFLTTRPEENRLLDNLPLPDDGAVLDVGCGVGRHLAYIRRKKPAVHCWGIERCDLMLDYCRRTIAGPATFVQSLDDLPNRSFDVIMLMGNGLGILGREEDAFIRLRVLTNLLTPTGRIVIETGNPFGYGYCAPEFTIEYGGQCDGPFPWGFADQDWVLRTMQTLGCEAAIWPSHAPGGFFFFAICRKKIPIRLRFQRSVAASQAGGAQRRFRCA